MLLIYYLFLHGTLITLACHIIQIQLWENYALSNALLFLFSVVNIF